MITVSKRCFISWCSFNAADCLNLSVYKRLRYESLTKHTKRWKLTLKVMNSRRDGDALTIFMAALLCNTWQGALLPSHASNAAPHLRRFATRGGCKFDYRFFTGLQTITIHLHAVGCSEITVICATRVTGLRHFLPTADNWTAMSGMKSPVSPEAANYQKLPQW